MSQAIFVHGHVWSDESARKENFGRNILARLVTRPLHPHKFQHCDSCPQRSLFFLQSLHLCSTTCINLHQLRPYEPKGTCNVQWTTADCTSHVFLISSYPMVLHWQYSPLGMIQTRLVWHR